MKYGQLIGTVGFCVIAIISVLVAHLVKLRYPHIHTLAYFGVLSGCAVALVVGYTQVAGYVASLKTYTALVPTPTNFDPDQGSIPTSFDVTNDASLQFQMPRAALPFSDAAIAEAASPGRCQALQIAF